MVREICLDSDILIELLKNNRTVQEKLSSLEASFAITAITSFEVWSGRKEREQTMINALLSSFHTLDFDTHASLKAADIWRTLKSDGTMLDIRDVFIASICITQNIALFTHNKKHFERLQEHGLTLI